MTQRIPAAPQEAGGARRALLLALCIAAATAWALVVVTPAHGEQLVLAPPGYMAFCVSHPNICATPKTHGRAILDLLSVVNYDVNHGYRQIHGDLDRWSLPVAAGNCHDLALEKKRRLNAVGIRSILAQVLTPNREGHIVLVVDNLVLDSLRDDLLAPSQTSYLWVSHEVPGKAQWMLYEGGQP